VATEPAISNSLLKQCLAINGAVPSGAVLSFYTQLLHRFRFLTFGNIFSMLSARTYGKEVKEMRTIGYIRVSTLEQEKNGISLEHQIHKIKAYVSLKGLGEVDIISDPGVSGKNLNRPGIQELLKLVRSGETNTVIVYKLDRLSRRTQDSLNLIEEFTKRKVDFHSISENVDTETPTGKFFLTVVSAISQMERDLIGERTADVLEMKKVKGEWVGRVPIGFRLRREGKGLQVDDEQMVTIAKVKRLRRKGLSIRGISEQVGVSKSSVQRLLKVHLRAYKNRYINRIAS